VDVRVRGVGSPPGDGGGCVIYILLFTIAMIASASWAAWDARGKKEDEAEDSGEYGFEAYSDYVETRCSGCGRQVCADETGTWVDNDGWDVCRDTGYLHIPA
jgi:hypothetical protein